PWGSPGGAGPSGWGEGRLGLPTEAATTATRPRLSISLTAPLNLLSEAPLCLNALNRNDWYQHLSNGMFYCRKRKELMESIKNYKPPDSSVSQARVLLVGQVGAGKSSFFNSINSVFRGHVTSQAMSGSSATSLTTQVCLCLSFIDGQGGKPLPITLCDTMGLEESKGAGLDVDDISSILKGHVPDFYQFNPAAPLHAEVQGYRKSPGVKDKIHCVAYVIDACKVSIMPTKLEEKLELVLLTKVDEANHCLDIKLDDAVGVPLSCVVPVKNYSGELELDLNCDILLLSAVIQMFRFTDNYFDELSDRLSSTELKD
uniref:Interferon-induced protein 44-like n=1 Tax=Fundulus heteroclitus TaxID=8078 RepID=A0A3Q2PXL7_FUNHE